MSISETKALHNIIGNAEIRISELEEEVKRLRKKLLHAREHMERHVEYLDKLADDIEMYRRIK